LCHSDNEQNNISRIDFSDLNLFDRGFDKLFIFRISAIELERNTKDEEAEKKNPSMSAGFE
jgi:hypothetical protein